MVAPTWPTPRSGSMQSSSTAPSRSVRARCCTPANSSRTAGAPFALNLATDDKHVLKVDAKHLAKRQKKRGVEALRYWTPEVHVAAFALPAYAQEVVEQAIARARDKGERAAQYLASLPQAPAPEE